MAQQVFTVQSSLSVSDAFDRCIDLCRVDEWDRGVTAPRRLTGEGHAVGSTYEVTVTGFDGAPTPVVYELLEVDAPRRFVMEGTTDVFRAYDVLTFAPTEHGCSLHYDARLELVGENPPLTPGRTRRTLRPRRLDPRGGSADVPQPMTEPVTEPQGRCLIVGTGRAGRSFDAALTGAGLDRDADSGPNDSRRRRGR